MASEAISRRESHGLAVNGAAAELIRASKSPNTLRCYESALRRFDAWSAGQSATDARLIPISPGSINRRFKQAAVEAGVTGATAHSGRVGLAAELIRRGASTTATQQAGGWKTARMVAHYSASVAAEDGAVSRYL